MPMITLGKKHIFLLSIESSDFFKRATNVLFIFSFSFLIHLFIFMMIKIKLLTIRKVK